MVTIKELLKNIAPGQSSLKLGYVQRALDAFSKSIAPRIQITYAKPELDGTTIYFLIPSESKAESFYDIVIWFDSTNRLNWETKIRVYSNSPGFAYNFTYLFKKDNSLLFPQYYPKEFLTMPPKIRNPLKTRGFDKHVYAAIKYLGKYSLPPIVDRFKEKKEPKVMTFLEKMSGPKEKKYLKDEKKNTK